MSTLETTAVIDAILVLLTEAYAGPPDPHQTWFIDNEPDSGILGLLAKISAAQASHSVDGSSLPGSSIAANTEHLRWSLANANRALRGEPYQGNWHESWHLQTVDEAQWQQIRQALYTEFEDLRDGLKQQAELPGDYLLGVLAMVPHAAFHLGVMRQMLARVQAAHL
jgi:hypothetical protein